MSHPLFPPKEEDGDAPEVLKIHVTRFEGGAKAVWCPRVFDAAELQSLETLYSLFGGGTYELIARDATNITARVTYAIPGKSRSLLGEDDEPAAAGPAAGLATADPNVQLIGLLVQMMQQQSQVQMSFMQSMQQSQDARSREHVQMMQTALQSQNQGTAQLYETLLKAGQGGSGADVNAVLEAIKVGVDLHSGASDQGDEFDFDKASEKAFKVIEMVQSLAQKKGSVAPAVPPNGAGHHPPTEPAPAPEPSSADVSE